MSDKAVATCQTETTPAGAGNTGEGLTHHSSNREGAVVSVSPDTLAQHATRKADKRRADLEWVAATSCDRCERSDWADPYTGDYVNPHGCRHNLPALRRWHPELLARRAPR